VLMLPHVLRHNMEAALPLYAELAPIVDPWLAGLGTQARAAGLIETLAEMSRTAGMEQRLREVGVEHGHLDMLADDAMLQTRLLRNNPCPITRDDARRLYEAAL
jgi:alcohol dehydrogenase class IV